MKKILGQFENNNKPVAIIYSRFNENIVQALVDGATDTLKRQGLEAITLIEVPGAFEIPLAAQTAAQTKQYQALICLGAVIRGETPHFDYVAGPCAQAIQKLSLDSGLPVAFGVLTTDTVEQAQARAGGKAGNKGREAAEVVLEMMSVIDQIRAQE